MTDLDLTGKTPAEIDELWAPIAARFSRAYAVKATAQTDEYRARNALARHAEGRIRLASWEFSRHESTIKHSAERIADAEAEMAAAETAMAPYAAEWTRRGGWTRAYLVVTKGQGHVHRSMNCSTCYPTTQFEWVTALSGASEQEIVDAAGERACTVCYASAPVALRLDRATTVFSRDEQAAAARREEKAAAKAVAQAAQITVEGFRDFGRAKTQVFKSERAATNALAAALSDLTWYGESHPSAAEWLANVNAIRAALAAEGVAFDYDKALANARKRTQRNGGQPKF